MGSTPLRHFNDESPWGARRILSQSTDSLNMRNRTLSVSPSSAKVTVPDLGRPRREGGRGWPRRQGGKGSREAQDPGKRFQGPWSFPTRVQVLK